ncbi:MAG: phosphatidate cytidylyltransferase, partial [Gammaproteobacteria bacterium]
MLKTRVITAIIVAPLALAALLLLEPTPFRAFIAIVLGVCAWEWANFAYLQQPGRIGFAVAVGLLTFFAPPDVNWLWIGLGLWSFTALLVLRFPKFPLILKRPAINLLVGV